VGPEKTVDVATRAGIPADTQGLEPYPSNVLGTAYPHPLDITSAYATFAAQGMRSTPHIVASVVDAQGRLIYEAPGADKRTKAFEPDIMAAATYAMTQVVEDPEGSGKPAQALERPVAGKTGTSNENRSAWFAGYVPQLATVVGLYQTADDGVSEAEISPFGGWETITGGTWPVEAWTSYMQTATANMPVEDFPEFSPPRPKPTETPTEEPTETPTEEPTEEAPVEQPENVTVPSNLVGMSKQDARAALQALGLKASITESYSDTVPRDVVISAGSPGAQVPPGSSIAVEVSRGPDPATQPTEEPTEEPTDEPTDGETEEPPGGGGGGGGGNTGGGNTGGGNTG
jgi:penicillin-binding protein 1A